MNKQIFLERLRKALRSLPVDEQDAIMQEYEQLFEDRILDGLTEQEVVKGLDSPQVIAVEFLKEFQVDQQQYHRSRISFSFVMALIMTGLFILWIWFAFMIICLSLVLSSIALIVASPVIFFGYFNLFILRIAGFLMLVGIGGLLGIGGLAGVKGLLSLAKSYCHWLMSLKEGN